ncbi:MAG: hypothetical protein JW774_02545 [Candidatus Aureabacteria bacterium]|nr:hypothetical protein [Candidatus Auribacterota bacterium]
MLGTISEEQLGAAEDFADVTSATLKTDPWPHAQTLIAGAARMAGTFLFRSFGLPLTGIHPGDMFLTDSANLMGPQLVRILQHVLKKLEIRLDEERMSQTPSRKDQPLLDFLQTQKQLEPRYTQIKDLWGLSLEEAAESASIAAGILIKENAPNLDPSIGYALAVYGFVTGSKTVPYPLPKDPA